MLTRMEISYEEFMKAAEDFYRGLEETELSNAFFGPLVMSGLKLSMIGKN